MYTIFSINTETLTYSDINNLNTTTTKGSGLSTNIGTSSDNFFKGISPNGTTSITHINEGNKNYNLVSPGLNNNGVNYVIPSYSIIRDKK